MDKTEFLEKLLDSLEYEVVKETIRDIVSGETEKADRPGKVEEDPAIAEAPIPQPEVAIKEVTVTDETAVNDLKTAMSVALADHKKIVSEYEKKLAYYQNIVNNYRSEIDRLNGIVSIRDGIINDLNSELANNTHQVNKAETLEAERDALKRMVDSLNEKVERQSSVIKRQERKRETLRNEMDNMFGGCRQIFDAYTNEVTMYTKPMLSEVMRHDEDYEAFIVSLANEKCLPVLWDTMRDCVMKGRYEDKDILWQMFELAVRLVNKTHTKPVFDILHTEIGDEMKWDEHSPMQGSNHRGVVKEVVLDGYINRYINKIMRRALVSIE